MISDVPFGAFLSGGIDSSLNVALMAHEIKKVKTFTVGFEGEEQTNELKWARMIAKEFDTDHHEIIITEQAAFDFFEKMIYHLDEPLADCVSIPFYYVAHLAKRSGVKVVQIGEGSDELFFGYKVYAQYLKLYKRFWRPTNYIVPKFAKKVSYFAGRSLFKKRASIVDTLYKWSHNKNLFWGGAIASSDLQKQNFINPQEELFDDPIVRKIYSGLTQSCDSHTIVDYHNKQLKKLDPDASFLKQMLYLELKNRLPELLLARADKMAMATSIEGRVPFLDHKLVEFALQIPDHLKFKNQETKYILKKACEGIIPNEIIYRKKMGFSAPIVRWFSHDGPFNQFFKKQNLELSLENDNVYNNALQKWLHLNFDMIKRLQ